MVILFTAYSSVTAAVDGVSVPPLAKTVYEKLSIKQEFPRDKVETLIVKADHAVVLIKQGTSESFSIQVMAQSWPKGIEIQMFKSRNGKALIVDGSAVPHKNLRIDYTIIVPKGVHIRLAGGIVEAVLEGIEGGDVFADVGRLILKSQGGFLSNFKGSAGEATIDISAITKDFLLACGGGTIKVRYVLPEKAKKNGLQIGRMPTVTLRQGAGRALFSFPSFAAVSYKSFSGVTSSFLSDNKQYDIRCLFYTAPGVQVGLSKDGP